LSGEPPAAPVLKARLSAEPVKPRRTQQGLFISLAPEPEKLELTIARIRHMTGPYRVGAAELVNTHRPDSFVMRAFAPGAPTLTENRPEPGMSPRMSLRRYRPPKYAQVILNHEQPARITSQPVNSAVVIAKGPWRTSGDWWSVDTWNRDEWDVETASGGLYRLYREIDSSRWFVEGSYD